MKGRNEKGQFAKGHKPYKFWLGKKFSKEYRKKLSLSHLGKKGFWTGKKRIDMIGNQWNKGKHLSPNTEFKKGENLKEKNRQWRGGISFEPYSTNWTKELKIKIRERDNYICQKCSQYGNVVHHIDYNKKNCNPQNLITLCRRCNSKVNFNREFWKKHFKIIIKTKVGNRSIT